MMRETFWMNGMKSFFACLVCFISCLTFKMESSEKVETALDRIDIQRSIYPQEKLYVVTDRDIYCGGDTLWFRIFVADADTHRQTAMSKYAYVELLNPFGKTEKRIKVMERDGVYAGYIPIDDEVYEGDYTLGAYTSYSESQGADYFFRKPLRLLSQYSSKYVIDSEFTPMSSGVVNGKFKLRSATGDKLNYNIMSWTMPDGKFLELPDSKKGFSRKFSRDNGENVVLVRFGDYRRYFTVEYPVENTYLTFYPEGGWLIADNPCKVAFKATDENGKRVAASGVIYDDTGEEVAKFKTVHNGMGSVTFVPEAGRTYKAEYTGPEGGVRTVEIGMPKIGTAALRYVSNGSKVTFSVAGGENRDLELVLSLRGMGVAAAGIDSGSPISFNKNEMPEGLYHAMLVSKTDSAVLSERIFFIPENRSQNRVSKLIDSSSIKLDTLNGIGGDCSVRITNSKLTAGKSDIDIRTQLMLQSELRGRIENPSYYFEEQNREREQHLDLLMMVNGWSRYNLPNAIQGRYEEPLMPLEIGQEISGQVLSRWRSKPKEGVMVSAIAPKFNFGTFADTDENGEFRINGFDFPEGTSFIFRAMNEKGGNESNYEIHEQKFPKMDVLREVPSSVISIEPIDFFNGIRWVMLDEIKVQAFNTEGPDLYETLASYSKTSEDMSSRGVTSLEQAVRTIPGLILKNNYLLYRNNNVAYYIDGTNYTVPAGGGTPGVPRVVKPSSLPGTYARPKIAGKSIYSVNPYNTRMLMTGTIPRSESLVPYAVPTLTDIEDFVHFQDIARIDFIRPENFILGEGYSGGALMITTKSGKDIPLPHQFELKDYLPLGYQNYKEYASPLLCIDVDDYDIQSKPTLLWLPSVKFEEDGETIKLTHPISSGSNIIVEGLMDNGVIIAEEFLIE